MQLAQQMVDNPLISRVLVNRLWHHLFGRGIVATVDDFGVMGQLPSHPELLDWLANDFVVNFWSVKTMIKKMVMSKTYRQSSQIHNAQAEEKDPDNLYLHRMRVRRLTAEQVRDGILKVTQNLNEQMFGGSVAVHLTSFMEGRGRARSGPLDGNGRRSLYLEVRRNFLSPMLMVFDFPAPFNSMGRRTVSNVPAQALTLMNDPFVHKMAEKWAASLLKAGYSKDELIKRLFVSAIGHPPNPRQIEVAQEFLSTQLNRERLKHLCHMVLNIKSFLYLN